MNSVFCMLTTVNLPLPTPVVLFWALDTSQYFLLKQSILKKPSPPS